MAVAPVWKPWEDFKKDVFDCPELPIEAPPCASCKFWSPRRTFSPDGTFDGIRLCHTAEQHFDFSCFQPRQSIVEATELGRPCAWGECENRLPPGAPPIRKYCSSECAERGKREVDLARKRELRERHIPNRNPKFKPAAAKAVAAGYAGSAATAEDIEKQQIEAFIRDHGVTKCPPVGSPEFMDLPVDPAKR